MLVVLPAPESAKPDAKSFRAFTGLSSVPAAPCGRDGAGAMTFYRNRLPELIDPGFEVRLGAGHEEGPEAPPADRGIQRGKELRAGRLSSGFLSLYWPGRLPDFLLAFPAGQVYNCTSDED
jgi:hypothetical protein